MKTTLLASTDAVGAIDWRLPSYIETALGELPPERRDHLHSVMGMMLSAWAHSICAEADYAMRSGEVPMIDMLAAMATFKSYQANRTIESAGTNEGSKSNN